MVDLYSMVTMFCTIMHMQEASKMSDWSLKV
jgi:hypothetical protein